MPKFFLLISLLFLTITLSACGSSSSTDAINSSNTNISRNRPDFGQPESKPDISGIVKSITGNEVTVLKIERTGLNRISSSSEESVKKVPSVSLGGSATNSGRGMGGGFRPEGVGSENQDAMLARLKEMSTGEETFIIPVGSQMLKNAGDDAKNREMIEATISDVTVNKMITVWLNSGISDRKVASFVIIN